MPGAGVAGRLGLRPGLRGEPPGGGWPAEGQEPPPGGRSRHQAAGAATRRQEPVVGRGNPRSRRGVRGDSGPASLGPRARLRLPVAVRCRRWGFERSPAGIAGRGMSWWIAAYGCRLRCPSIRRGTPARSVSLCGACHPLARGTRGVVHRDLGRTGRVSGHLYDFFMAGGRDTRAGSGRWARWQRGWRGCGCGCRRWMGSASVTGSGSIWSASWSGSRGPLRRRRPGPPTGCGVLGSRWRRGTRRARWAARWRWRGGSRRVG